MILSLILGCLSISAFAKPSLVVYSCDPQGSATIQKVMDKFGAANDCEVKLQTYPSDTYMQVLTAAVNAGSQIDVVYANGQGSPLHGPEGNHHGPDRQGEVSGSIFPQHARSLHFLEEGLRSTVGVREYKRRLLQQALFAKAGITKIPSSYEEFVQAASVIKKTGASPIAMGGGDIYMWPMWFFQTFAQTAKNRSFERTVDTLLGKARFTDPDYVEAMAALARIGKDDLFMPGVNGTSMDSARAAFVSGKAAMFYGGTWGSAAGTNPA